MFSRQRIILGVLGAMIVDLLLGSYFRAGKIMTQSHDPRIKRGTSIVKVREIRRFPIWGFFLATLDDNPQYRFEYYRYNTSTIWSSQSYKGESYIANRARIAWGEDGTATVYLDERPLFDCNGGTWREINSR